MTDTTSRAVFKPDSDVHITLEDQQKINLFAKYNAKHEDFKSEIQLKQRELQNLEDAEDELLLRSDEDAEEKVPIRKGDNFIYMSTAKAMDTLKQSHEKIDSDIKTMQDAMATIKDEMSTLKTQLYAKFGTHINLEGDE